MEQNTSSSRGTFTSTGRGRSVGVVETSILLYCPVGEGGGGGRVCYCHP